MGSIMGEGAARQVRFHVGEGEGAVRVEGDSARSGIIKFAVNEMTGFARRRKHHLLLSLIGPESFVCVCRDRGQRWERYAWGGGRHVVIAGMKVVSRDRVGEVAGERALVDGADLAGAAPYVLLVLGESGSV